MGRKIAPWLGVEVWRLKVICVLEPVWLICMGNVEKLVMLARWGDLSNAKVVLDAMPEKSVASFTIMIDGYAKAGDGYLKGFEHVYGDIVSGVVDVNELGFLVKHME
ncbi:hypothetical protein HN873_004953, partial [Arachis hypogaea]